MNAFYRAFVVLTVLAGVSLVAVGQNGAPANDSSVLPPLSCSLAPCVLPPTQVSPGPNGVNSAPIVVNPSNLTDIIVGSNDRNCGFEGEPSLGFFLSFGGSNWDQYCMLGRAVGGHDYVPVGEPILAFARNGMAYLGGFYADSNSGSNIAFEAFQKSRDGVHWSLPAVSVYRRDYIPYTCWMTADANLSSQYLNSVYVSCAMSGPIQNPKYNQMVVSRSDNGGATWHQVNVAPPQVSPAEDLYNSMAIGKDGSVYLAWQYCDQQTYCENGPAYMVFSKSTDGGHTWSKPTPVAPVALVYPLPNAPGIFVRDTPAIGVDMSNGPHAGNLYVAMYNWTGTFMQVVVARSTDSGATWSKPVPVAPGFTNDQFFPWLSVSPNGLVGVVWLDRRNDPNNIEYQAFAAISSDGGLSFQPNVQLTQNFSNPVLGDIGSDSYNGAAWDGPNYFIAAWMDSSNGVNMQDVVGGIRLK